jgi:hypothetical protein
MQPLEVGTIVRFKNEDRYQHYGKTIFGQVNELMVSGEYAPKTQVLHYRYLTLCRADGTPLQIAPVYVNATPEDYLEIDTFMHACREAIKEAQ